MKLLQKKFSKNLIFDVVIFFVAFILSGACWYLVVVRANMPQPPETTDPFVLAQYYFNQDNSIDGVYDLKKARQYYSQVIEENPGGNPLSWYQLGRIDFLEGYLDDAIYKFKKQVYYFDDQLPNVYYMLGLTYGYKAGHGGSAEDWTKAEENFLKYIEYDELSPWPKVDLTWIYFAQGKYSEMIPVLESGLMLEPNNPWLLNMYGLALLNTGAKESARLNFIKARDAAAILTPLDWGMIYPGNDPDIWEKGLEEFRSLIEKNISLTQ